MYKSYILTLLKWSPDDDWRWTPVKGWAEDRIRVQSDCLGIRSHRLVRFYKAQAKCVTFNSLFGFYKSASFLLLLCDIKQVELNCELKLFRRICSFPGGLLHLADHQTTSFGNVGTSLRLQNWRHRLGPHTQWGSQGAASRRGQVTFVIILNLILYVY